MTDIEWGAEIAVNGKRPEWYRNERCVILNDQWQGLHDGGYNNFTERSWNHIKAIRIPADHPYYLATSRGFTYWPGGESAPDDWDGGETLKRAGHTWNTSDPNGSDWQRGYAGDASCMSEYDIIGYRKRTEQPAPTIAPELIERMVALVKYIADGGRAHIQRDAKAILAELEPDPDLTLAKSIMGDAEAIALAIKAARENGSG